MYKRECLQKCIHKCECGAASSDAVTQWQLKLAILRVCGSWKYGMYACVNWCETVIVCSYQSWQRSAPKTTPCYCLSGTRNGVEAAYNGTYCAHVAQAAKHVKILYSSQYLEIEANADFSHILFSAFLAILYSFPTPHSAV